MGVDSHGIDVPATPVELDCKTVADPVHDHPAAFALDLDVVLQSRSTCFQQFVSEVRRGSAAEEAPGRRSLRT